MCVTKKDDMTRKEFQEYWLNTHGELLKKFAKTYNVKKYTQSHTIDSSLNENVRKSRQMPELEYDGIGELWWESEKEFIEAISSEEGVKLRTVFLDDEAKFLNFSKSTAFFTKEFEIVK
jgi:hypothetical protein